MENVAGGDKHSKERLCRDVWDETLSFRGQTEVLSRSEIGCRLRARA